MSSNLVGYHESSAFVVSPRRAPRSHFENAHLVSGFPIVAEIIEA